jgi:wobble nucleotide-excising tRNase
MITKISKIKNLGLVFKDFTWKTGVSDFNRFNLIYGWNGCGKTTFTRLFDAVSGNTIPALEYEIEEGGTKYDESATFPKRIRLFNQDYIEKNVEILDSRANSISILLGEENKELLEAIEADEIKLNGDPGDAKEGLVKEHYGYTKKKERKEKDLDTKYTGIASTIGAATLGSSSASRNYRSPNARADFSGLTFKEELTDEDLIMCATAIKQDLLPEQTLIAVRDIFIPSTGARHPISVLLESVEATGKEVLKKTVESQTIARLAENPDISEWVEKGIELHSKHKSDSCEYCGNSTSPERIKLLAAHFNDADKNLKSEIDVLVNQLKEIYTALNSIEIHDPARLYSELRTSFEESKETLILSRKTVLEAITNFAEELKSKKNLTNESVESTSSIDLTSFAENLEVLNAIIRTHNGKTADFQKVKDEAVSKIKKHYLSTIFDDVKKLEGDIETAVEDVRTREVEITEIKARIAANKAKVSSTHKACEEINKGLATFLGRKELTFIPHTKKSTDEEGLEVELDLGYRIMRGTEPASHLSEGEKTAIAFVYFIVHLKDGDFPLADGIVVIDDPISSLDSNSLYQAFSFLKNSVEDCAQIFILTHSFEFLKLLLNWRKGTHSMKGETGFFMIKNTFENGVRKAHIEEMDKELVAYESEYHYLFHLLKKMRDEHDDSIEQSYPIPNIARKVWETFLMFRVPNGQNPHSKMTILKKDYDPQKLDAIYKFTNDQSHMTGSGFDPALVPESKKVVGEILEMMNEISPEHFKIIDEATA